MPRGEYTDHRANYLKKVKASGKWGEMQRRYNRDSSRRSYIKLKMKLFDMLGGMVCVRCGFNDIRALQFDHINGDGHHDTRGSAWKKYKMYVEDPNIIQKLQVLCANCNWIKRVQNKEYANVKT